MSIRNDYNKVVTELDKCKTEFKEKLNSATNNLMSEFERDTGFVITGIDIDLLVHYSGGQVAVDKSILSDIKIKTNIDSD